MQKSYIIAASALAVVGACWGICRARTPDPALKIGRSLQKSEASATLEIPESGHAKGRRQAPINSPSDVGQMAGTVPAQGYALHGDSDLSPRSKPSAQGPKEQDEANVKALDNAIKSESVDLEWARAMESRVTTFFQSGEQIGSAVRRIDCKSTLCRVDVSFDSNETRHRFGIHVGAMIPPRSTAFVYIENEEDRDISVYFARADHPLPVE